MSNRFVLLSFIVMVMGASFARADVWQASQQWDDQQDQQFSQWIRTLPMNIFNHKGTAYDGIPTDCADAAYVLRVIYAYEHSLPIAFSDHQLSNTNKSFDATPAGMPRLRKFLQFVRATVNTRSLVADTYPLAINRRAIKAGALFVHPQSGASVPITYRSGHVYYLQDVFENGMVRYFSSTVPSMVRDLQPRIDITFAPFTQDGGYRAWKRPFSNERPNMSSEQFSLAGWHANGYRDGDLWEAWSHAIRLRLQQREATPQEELSANVENIRGYVKERVNLINKSWALFQSRYHGTECMSNADYDSYSTPTRDVKIQAELQSLQEAALKYLSAQGQSRGDLHELFSQYTFSIGDGRTVDLNQLWQTFESETVLSISEPEHSPEVRWGLEKQEHWVCPQRAKQYVGGERIGQ